MLAAEWAADWKTPDLFIDKFPVDSITNWRMQCKMFAFMTRCAQDAFLSAFKARASATELFIVQMIGVEGLKALKKDPNRTLSAALGEATAANLPLGNTLIPDVIKRHIKVLGVDVADPTGHQFIAQTAAALVPDGNLYFANNGHHSPDGSGEIVRLDLAESGVRSWLRALLAPVLP